MEIKKASLSAFYAAEVGIERAIDELRKNGDWWKEATSGFGDRENPFILTQEGDTQPLGYYWIDRDGENNSFGDSDDDIQDGGTYQNWPTTVWIRSYGQDPTRRITRIIAARIAIQSPTEYLLSTPQDIVIRGGANITADILGRDIRFFPSSTPINVNGKVYYIRNIENEDNPYVHITCSDSECIVKIPSITFASIDLEWYKELAEKGGIYIGGDFAYSGKINWEQIVEAADNAGGEINGDNGIIFVEGDVYIAGEIETSVHIISAGNIYITGNIEKTEEDTQLGLSAKENIIISEEAPYDLTVEAFVRADGGIFYAEGEKNSKGNFTFSGAISLRGSSEAESAIDLNVYQNRSYQYDTGLRTNLTIPFVNYIANIIEWKQLSAQDTFPPLHIP
ncbi:MAG TPA: hypothetical protein ENG74_01850 [Thermoplasmatales archaeon]|nr:hypothetical protein [Thermoplasmatales archaeon]